MGDEGWICRGPPELFCHPLFVLHAQGLEGSNCENVFEVGVAAVAVLSPTDRGLHSKASVIDAKTVAI